jgi:hypothetical protein
VQYEICRACPGQARIPLFRWRPTSRAIDSLIHYRYSRTTHPVMSAAGRAIGSHVDRCLQRLLPILSLSYIIVFARVSLFEEACHCQNILVIFVWRLLPTPSQLSLSPTPRRQLSWRTFLSRVDTGDYCVAWWFDQ